MHIVIMVGGDHGVNWLGQVLADNIQILGGPMQGFVEWGATLAAMHDQQTQKRGNTPWSCHAEGRHRPLSGGPHAKRGPMQTHSTRLMSDHPVSFGRQANAE